MPSRKRQPSVTVKVPQDDPRRLEVLLECARAVSAIVAKVDAHGPQVAVMGATGCTVNVEGGR